MVPRQFTPASSGKCMNRKCNKDDTAVKTWILTLSSDFNRSSNSKHLACQENVGRDCAFKILNDGTALHPQVIS